MEVRKIITGIGCLSHHSLVDINNRIWFASEDGIRLYNGAPRHVSEDVYTYYRDDLEANRAIYSDSVAVNFKKWQIYMLLTPKSSTQIYVGYYQDTDPATGGDGRSPYWSFDAMARKTNTLNIIFDTDGTEKIYYGGCDGYIREEDSSNTDDDGDSDGKITWIQSRHETHGLMSGDASTGWEVKFVHSYLESENESTVIEVFGGDESIADLAQDTSLRDDEHTITATAVTDKQTLCHHKHVIKGVAGRGYTIIWHSTGARSTWRWRGYGAEVAKGRARRRSTD
jgi:hypothetical protein